MQFTKFGQTGLTVSRMALGTGTFGKQTDEAEAHGMLDKVADAGVNFIDTADMYPLDEMAEAMDMIVRSGKARYIGVSNFLAYRLARALGRQDTPKLARFVSAQPRYNLLFRESERELFPLAQEDGIAVIPYNPLAGGLLSGRYRHSDMPEKGRFSTELGGFGELYHARYWHEREFETVGKIQELAKEQGTPIATLSVVWILANPAITSVIVGASRIEQLTDTLAAAEYKLDSAVRAKLDEVSIEFRRGDADK
jgi:aryl-alcohol dehydrogenase-like predicted oxidoreductase